ncbi:hypothetical protein LXL04_021911 [Taraxacum kok-saghyz]
MNRHEYTNLPNTNTENSCRIRVVLFVSCTKLPGFFLHILKRAIHVPWRKFTSEKSQIESPPAHTSSPLPQSLTRSHLIGHRPSSSHRPSPVVDSSAIARRRLVPVPVDSISSANNRLSYFNCHADDHLSYFNLSIHLFSTIDFNLSICRFQFTTISALSTALQHYRSRFLQCRSSLSSQDHHSFSASKTMMDNVNTGNRDADDDGDYVEVAGVGEGQSKETGKRKRQKKQTSPVWNVFELLKTKDAKGVMVDLVIDGKRKEKCSWCGEVKNYDSTTGNEALICTKDWMFGEDNYNPDDSVNEIVSLDVNEEASTLKNWYSLFVFIRVVHELKFVSCSCLPHSCRVNSCLTRIHDTMTRIARSRRNIKRRQRFHFIILF